VAAEQSDPQGSDTPVELRQLGGNTFPSTSALGRVHSAAMAVVQFADGRFVVDDVYVGPLREVCGGETQRFPFKDAMKRLGPAFEKQFLRNVQQDVIARHFRPRF